MFGWVKNTLRKSEAALLVQQALEHHMPFGSRPFDPDKQSTLFVARVWDHKPDVFEGKLGKPPHKMSIAAFALATALRDFEDDDEAEIAILLALGAVLLDLFDNEPFYDLAGADRWLIERANQAYCEVVERRRPAQDALLGSAGFSSETVPSTQPTTKPEAAVAPNVREATVDERMASLSLRIDDFERKR